MCVSMNSQNIEKTQVELTESDLKLIARLERTEAHLRMYYLFSACTLLLALGLIVCGPIIGSETIFFTGMVVLLIAESLLAMLWNGSKYLKLIQKLLRGCGQAIAPEEQNK